MSKQEFKCAGVIVTFNRKELLAKNIEMQIKQVRKINRLYIIDNHGTDDTYDYLVENNLFCKDWMEYIYLDENTGGAGGFNYGMKTAYEAGYDFIWLMDDDGRPQNNETWNVLYNTCIEIYTKKRSELFLNCLVTVDGKKLAFSLGSRLSMEEQWENIQKIKNNTNLLEKKANPFNGTLVSKEAIAKVGFPNKDFFISRDETDYFRRCEDAGVYIATVLNSIYHHPYKSDGSIKFGRIKIPFFSKYEKEYYWVRNLTYSYKDKHKFRLLCMLIGQFVAIIFFEKEKSIRIKQFFKAISDARKGVLGKYK